MPPPLQSDVRSLPGRRRRRNRAATPVTMLPARRFAGGSDPDPDDGDARAIRYPRAVHMAGSKAMTRGLEQTSAADLQRLLVTEATTANARAGSRRDKDNIRQRVLA